MLNIIDSIQTSIAVKQKILESPALLERLEEVIQVIITTYKQGGKLLLCGNGGSAADAQHLAAELSGRFYYDREPLAAEALHVNSSYMTAVANDYSFDEVYARMIRAVGKKNDVLIGLSTSGNSVNVLKAFEAAKKLDMTTIALTGESGGMMKENVHYLLNVPSINIPRIQEAHILLGHIICEKVERIIFPKKEI